MQQTSLEAYYTRVKPQLSPKRQAVLEAIEDLGACTDKQIAKHLGWDRCCVTGRRGELYEKGLIDHVFTADGEMWWDLK